MNRLEWIWPAISDEDSAAKAAGSGAWAAILVAVVTAAVACLQSQKKINLFPGAGAEAYFDAGLFFLVAAGLFRKSRVAALAGLGLYVFEQVMVTKRMGVGLSFAGFYFIFVFIGSTRGAFAYHRFRREQGEDEKRFAQTAAPPAPAASAPASAPAAAPAAAARPASGGRFGTKKMVFAAAALGGLALVLAAIFVIPRVIKDRSQTQDTPVKEAGALQDPHRRTFHLKSGQVIQGRVVYEDETYYRIETSLGREEVVVREDVA